ncbi:MAG: hypothetical protein CFE26_28415, partial [Verrucomicrobiales bacterium VVV1]
LRRALETQAAIMAASRIEPDEVARLEALVDRMEENVANLDGWVAADCEFHQSVAHYSGNSLIAFLIVALGDTIRDVISALHTQTKVRDNKATILRHREIVHALAAHDPERASRAIAEHFSAAAPAVAAVMAVAAKSSERSVLSAS